jgi:hypothetical protein
LLRASLARRRRDGLVALGRLRRTEPLLEAPEISEDHDTECPQCGGWGIGDPEATMVIFRGRLRLLGSASRGITEMDRTTIATQRLKAN